MQLFCVLFIVVVNSLDAFLTAYGTHYGIIGEANPLMNWLLQQSETAFLLFKLSLPLVLLFLLPWLVSKAIQRLLVVTCAIYCCVLSLHGIWLFEHFKWI
ncbi:DUF5658 family protein [Paenibacillus agricola]|uniref:DUF5658 domain-containing protein n=1 Tax=Paenibacillus agricola TaxID=2716264 RepID=A0ABX0J374_9BACL|nr:DUF5658 family protein [Paenibacillus agricola]NHN29569.1 hypothetical protein [Paenibacillus agricola]